MTTPSKNMLTEAIAAARAGDRSRAQDLLSRLLRADSSNAEYWVWMSAVVDSKRERIYCLESALKLDPTNRAAMRGLVILGARVPEEAELASAIRIPRRQVAAIASGPTIGRGVNIPWNWVAKGALGLVSIAVIWGLVLVIGPWLKSLVSSQPFRPASTLPPISPTPTATLKLRTPTITPVPAATRVMRTPIPTELAGTPLIYLADITSTSTPILGVTPHIYEDYNAGIKALIRGDYEQTLNYMEKVIEYDPDLPDAHYFKGEALRLMDEIANAIKAYDQAVNVDSDYAPAYLGRGRALLLRNTEAALNDFSRAIMNDPTMTEVHLELGTYYASSKLWIKLEDTMEAAIDVGVTTPMIYIRLSEAQLNMGKYTEALENALEGSANDSTLLLGYLAVGRAYVANGVDTFDPDHFNSASWPLQTFLTYEPEDHRGWADLGRAQVGLGYYDEALISLNLALEIKDNYSPTYLARGILFTETGDYEAAIEDLTQARRYSPENYILMLATGRAYFLNGEYIDALDFINPAIEFAGKIIQVKNRELKLAEGYALLAQVYESIDQIDDAIIRWMWILDFTYIRPETRFLAEEHLAELTGEGPTRTPTPSPTATLTVTPTPTSTSTKTPSATPTP